MTNLHVLLVYKLLVNATHPFAVHTNTQSIVGYGTGTAVSHISSLNFGRVVVQNLNENFAAFRLGTNATKWKHIFTNRTTHRQVMFQYLVKGT